MVARRLWNGGNAGAKLFVGRSGSVWLQGDRPLAPLVGLVRRGAFD